MKIEDLMKLVNAGFTRDEILRFTGPLATDPPFPPDAAAEPAPAAADVPVETEPEPAAPAAPAAPDNSEVLAALKDLTNTIRKTSIMRDTLQETEKPSAVDVLASIINPSNNKPIKQ